MGGQCSAIRPKWMGYVAKYSDVNACLLPLLCVAFATWPYTFSMGETVDVQELCGE